MKILATLIAWLSRHTEVQPVIVFDYDRAARVYAAATVQLINPQGRDQ